MRHRPRHAVPYPGVRRHSSARSANPHQPLHASPIRVVRAKPFHTGLTKPQRGPPRASIPASSHQPALFLDLFDERGNEPMSPHQMGIAHAAQLEAALFKFLRDHHQAPPLIG